MAEYLRVDLHGNHNQSRPDDGRDPIRAMVRAAKRRSLVPALTGHNTTAAYHEYGESMEEMDMGNVRLYGVEFDFSVTAGNLAIARRIDEYVGVRIFPGVQRFTRNLDRPTDKVDDYPPEVIRDESKRITALIDQVSRSGSRQELELVKNDLGFALFYLRSFRMTSDHKASAEVISHLRKQPTVEADFLALMARIYGERGENVEKLQRVKGELVCIMPQEKSIRNRVAKLIDVWREGQYGKTESLSMLFHYLRRNLTDTEYKSLLFVLPHPVSLDASWWGKIATHLMEGDVTLFASEVFVPEVAAEIHAIEVLNGATPDYANRISARMAENVLLNDKARTGGGDAHHRQWVGSAATLVEVDEVSTDGIIDGVKRRRTLPVSGWGELSNTPIPFVLWAMTVPVNGRSFAPMWVSALIERMINIEEPMQRAIEQNLMNKSRNTLWVY